MPYAVSTTSTPAPERSEVVLTAPNLTATAPRRPESPSRFPVLRISGDVDTATAPQLQEFLRDQLSGAEHAVLDLSAVEFLGVAGVEVLVRANRQSPVRLVAQHGPVRRALAVTGADEELAVHPSVVDAELCAEERALSAAS